MLLALMPLNDRTCLVQTDEFLKGERAYVIMSRRDPVWRAVALKKSEGPVMKRIGRIIALFFLPVLAFGTRFSSAQKPESRISGTITDADRIVLAGSRTRQALHGVDSGPVAPETVIPGITLVFKRSAAQENALDELLAAQQNPESPLYHHWLTPDVFAARFGVADEDIATTEAWLRLHGFKVESSAPNADRITFSGTAAQVQEAFGTELRYYRAEGELHFAPAADLKLPASLGSITAAVLHLSDFRPKPEVKVQTHPRPDFTSSSTQAHYLTPKDLFMMYDFSSAMQQKFNGSGQGLAVVGQAFVDTSLSPEISQFQTILTQYTAITPVLVPGSGIEAVSPGDEAEADVDLEYASGIAQNANIFYVYVGNNQNYDVLDALAFAIAQDIAPVVSISYGFCETSMSATELDQGNALLEQAAAQGQTIVASGGDRGSTACASSASGQWPLSVIYPASSPYVTAVGGTQMAAGTFASGSGQYWSGATNIDTVSSLLSYVPEVVWNEDSLVSGLAAGGGGTSSYFSRPAWQSGVPGIPAGSYRLVPDIALQSSIESPGFLVCLDNPVLLNSEGENTSCTNGLLGGNNKYTTSGGTSFAAPVFAGFVAILNEMTQANGLGNINPVLYKLASDPASYSAAFHDITSGTNACVAGIGGCTAPGSSAYAAGPGYDEATGLGSIDFAHLAAAWPASKPSNLTQTTTLIVPTEHTAAPGASVPLQIDVQSFDAPYGTPIPTGSVSITLDGTVVAPALTFSSTDSYYSSSTANYSFIAPSTAGSHLVRVSYSGDATHTPSVATYSVMVGNVTASGAFTLSASDVTIANGGTGSTQIVVTPSGGYNGRILWSISATTSTGGPAFCYRIGSQAVSGPTTTTLNLGAGSVCNPGLPAQSAYQSAGPGASVGASRRDGDQSPRRDASTISLCMGLLIFGSIIGRRRRPRLPRLLLTIALTVSGVCLNGCGGASSNAGGGGGSTTKGIYTFTVRGSDSANHSITASTTFTLTIE